MSDHSERRERGERLFREVTGMEPPAASTPAMEISLLEFAMGDVWSRPGITRKERRWIALTSAAASSAPAATEAHIRAALQSGDITVDELREWVLQLTAYIGWPKSAMLDPTITRIAGELGG